MGEPNSSDERLIERMLSRDAAAFDGLLERHSEMVRRCLLQIVRDDATARDLLQEAFLRLWTRAEQWDGRGSLSGWLLRVATNLALNHLRSVRRRRSIPLEPPVEAVDEEGEEAFTVPGWMVDRAALKPEEIVMRAEERQVYRRLFDALPEEKREALRLAHEAEMDIQAISDELGVPPGTVKSRLHYGRKELAEGLERLEEEEGL